MANEPSVTGQESAWVDTHRVLLDRAFEDFMETGEWPKVASLRRWSAQERNDADVQAVVDSRPRFEGEVRGFHQEQVAMMIRHLRYLPKAEPLVNLCVVIARQGAVVYRTPGAELQVSSEDSEVAAAAAGDARLISRAGTLLNSEQPSPFAGGGRGDDRWQYYINESFVLDFEHVANADEFVAVQNRILDARSAQRQQTGYNLPPGLYKGSVWEGLGGVGMEEEFGAAFETPSEPTEEHPSAFISHASEDKDRFVTEFATKLRANGINAWVDEWEIAAGQSLVGRIFDQGIKDADVFIIVLSSFSIEKPWVVKELNAAVIQNIDRGCHLIPVVLDGVEPPVVLKDHLWVPIADLGQYDAELQKIVRAIFGVDNKPPIGPVPGYIARPAGIHGMNPQDAQVLSALARTALESHFGHPDYEAARSECLEAGLDEAAFQESLEALGKAYLIKYQRSGGNFIVGLSIRHRGFVRYLEASRSDLPALRRTLKGLLLNEYRQGTDLETLAGRLQEPEQLVRVLLDELETRKMLTLVRTFGGTTVMNISSLLAREL